MSAATRPGSARLVALIVAVAFFMQNLDGAIINSSLPQMAASFGTRTLELSSGVTAYIVMVATVLPLSGWLADRLGARPVFLGAIAVFTLASIGCGAAETLPQFVAARMLQGAGGALMAPVGRMVVLRNATKAELLGATALITWPALVAPVIGPALGGAITTYANWRWNFLLNLPLGLVGLVLVAIFVPNPKADALRRFDWGGFMLSAGALMLLLTGLEMLAHVRHDPLPALLLTAAGVALGLIAIRHLRRVDLPLIDLTAMRTPTFAASTIGMGLLYRLAINATPFLLPLLFQIGFSLNAAQSGLLILAYFLGNLGMKSITSPTLRRFGFRPVLIVNGAIGAVAIAACGLLLPGTARVLVIGVLLLAGLTRSMQFTSLNTLSFADVEDRHRGAAATLSAVSQQVSSVLGIAVATVLLNASVLAHGRAAVALADFPLAFGLVGLLALIASFGFWRLPRDAGAEVSGHRPSAPARPETTSTPAEPAKVLP
jgi:EmrB/QacA subfamily drug resistance transporter